MIRLRNRLAVAGVLAVLASCLSVRAQNVVSTGSLGGRVTDQSGAVVPGASITVRNLATGVQQSAETNYAGLYRFPVLVPGSYSITASLKGFRDVEALVRVLVGNATLQDVKLHVGAGAVRDFLHSPAGEKEYKKLKTPRTGARKIEAPAIAEFLGWTVNRVEESLAEISGCIVQSIA